MDKHGLATKRAAAPAGAGVHRNRFVAEEDISALNRRKSDHRLLGLKVWPDVDRGGATLHPPHPHPTGIVVEPHGPVRYGMGHPHQVLFNIPPATHSQLATNLC